MKLRYLIKKKNIKKIVKIVIMVILVLRPTQGRQTEGNWYRLFCIFFHF